MSIATVDIQNCEDWPRIKQGMQEALEESDSELWVSALFLLFPGILSSLDEWNSPDLLFQTASLQLLARGLAVNNTCTKDIYVTIGMHSSETVLFALHSFLLIFFGIGQCFHCSGVPCPAVP